jgi:acetylornithine deacetylase/succinyl-diaminopimelate desuccinylase-like protein
MRDIGPVLVDASVREAAGKPVAAGEYRLAGGPSHAPRLLFYGHYDVQPADPLDQWTSAPFEPQNRGAVDGTEQIFARCAFRGKGQLMAVLEACRAVAARVSSPARGYSSNLDEKLRVR